MTSFPSQQSICSSVDGYGYFRFHLPTSAKLQMALSSRVPYSNMQEAVPTDNLKDRNGPFREE